MTTDDARQALMISFAFPPTGGPGVQRSAKFAKYLPEVGWRPIVWCADPIATLPRDHSLREELPDEVAVHTHPHTAADATPTGPAHRWKRWLRRTRRAKAITPECDRHLDEFIAWARSSVEPALTVCRTGGVRVLYSTFSPASNHCLALELKLRTGLPWVADFRDLWTDDYRYVAASHARAAADRRLQRHILQTADAVIGVTPRQTRILAGHVPLEREKFVTITNGYDPDDFGRAERLDAPRDVFVLAHVGRLDRYRSHPALFGGLSRFLDEVPEALSKFRFDVVGHLGSDAAWQLQAREIALSHTGYVGHAEAVSAMQRADALLLAVPTGPNADSVIPAKLFEYLAAGRPILVVGPRGGECERIVLETASGVSAGFDEVEIAGALRRLFTNRDVASEGDAAVTTAIEHYSRRTQAGRLADIFNGLSRDPVAAPSFKEADVVGVS